MRPELTTDLARWERGAARMDDLLAAHPDDGTDELLEVHAWLTFLASDQTDEPGPSWDEVAARLPDHRPAVGDRPNRSTRRVIAGLLAAAVLTPASAVAASTDRGRTLVDGTARQVAQLMVPQLAPSGDATDDLGEPVVPSVMGAWPVGRAAVVADPRMGQSEPVDVEDSEPESDTAQAPLVAEPIAHREGPTSLEGGGAQDDGDVAPETPPVSPTVPDAPPDGGTTVTEPGHPAGEGDDDETATTPPRRHDAKTERGGPQAIEVRFVRVSVAPKVPGFSGPAHAKKADASDDSGRATKSSKSWDVSAPGDAGSRGSGGPPAGKGKPNR